MPEINLDNDQLGTTADLCMMSSVMGARMLASKLQGAWQARMAPGAEPPGPLVLSEDECATIALACASTNEPDSKALADMFAAGAGEGFELPVPVPMAEQPPNTPQPEPPAADFQPQPEPEPDPDLQTA
jgi:hypothetical protein